MENLDSIAEKTIEFLRRFGRLSDRDAPPVFEELYRIPEYFNPIVLKQPWKRNDPLFYTPAREGERVVEQFGHATKNLRALRRRDIERKLLEIPDSSEFTLVDIGSGTGRRFTNEFSFFHRTVQVVMVDFLSPDELSKELGYTDVENQYSRAIGLQRKIPIKDDVEQTMNDLLQANGFYNAHYVQRKLTVQDGSQLTNILFDTKGKRLIFTGFKNPRQLGYITLKEAQYNEGECACVTMSGLELLQKDDPIFKIVAERLKTFGLSNEEIDKYYFLLHDPNPQADGKYRWNDSGQGMFGMMLKQLFNVVVAKEFPDYQVELLIELGKINMNLHYNQPSHVIYAHDGENLLNL